MEKQEYNYCIKNICRGMYNCGGFAFKTFDWFLLNTMQKNFKTICEEFDYDSAIESILTQIEDIRVINNLNECLKDESPVILRMRKTFIPDFHFARRGKNGIWYHKMGSLTSIRKTTWEEINADSWCNDYTSKVIIFAMKD